MTKKLTQQEFVTRARSVHGDKYDYSKVVYINNSTKVTIKCQTCGLLFFQTPSIHLSGHGCSHCARYKIPQLGKRDIVAGVGIFDVNYSRTKDKLTQKAYRDWTNMLYRCYGNGIFQSKPAYKDCKVCDEWLLFSNFKKWFDNNYKPNCELDKDILVRGNKVYSPDTCCYIPRFLNTLLLNCRSARGTLPIGVEKTNGGNFMAKIWKYGKQYYIGCYHTPKEAFLAYKSEKETYIIEVSQDYFNKGLINENIYNALINYRVNITD